MTEPSAWAEHWENFAVVRNDPVRGGEPLHPISYQALVFLDHAQEDVPAMLAELQRQRERADRAEALRLDAMEYQHAAEDRLVAAEQELQRQREAATSFEDDAIDNLARAYCAEQELERVRAGLRDVRKLCLGGMPSSTVAKGALRMIYEPLLAPEGKTQENAEPMSTDFPGQPRGRGDTITVVGMSERTPEDVIAAKCMYCDAAIDFQPVSGEWFHCSTAEKACDTEFGPSLLAFPTQASLMCVFMHTAETAAAEQSLLLAALRASEERERRLVERLPELLAMEERLRELITEATADAIDDDPYPRILFTDLVAILGVTEPKAESDG